MAAYKEIKRGLHIDYVCYIVEYFVFWLTGSSAGLVVTEIPRWSTTETDPPMTKS